MYCSAKLIHFLGYNSVDYGFRVAVADEDCTNVGKFSLKSRFGTDDWSSVDKNRNQIDFPFYGTKRIPANALASESRLSVNRCSKFVIVFFYQDIKKGKVRLHSFSKVKQSDEWREFRWERNLLHSSLSSKAAKVSSTYR